MRVALLAGAVVAGGFSTAKTSAQPSSAQPSSAQPSSAEPSPAEPSSAPTAPPSGPAPAAPPKIRDASTPDSGSAAEDAGRYEPPWLLSAGAGLQVNNVYGGLAATIRYRNTYGRSDSRLVDNLYWEAGGGVTASLLVNFVRAYVEWSPVAVLRLRATYRGRFTFGIPTGTGAGLPFANAAGAFGDDVLRARQADTIASYGHQVLLEPVLQAKLWRFILMNQFVLGLHYLHGGPDYLYINEADALLRRGSPDLTVHEQPIVLFDIHQGPGFHKLYAGAYYELDFTAAANIVRHRVGLMLLYSPLRSTGVLFEPTLLLMGGLNLIDRNRQGTPFVMLVLQSGFILGSQRAALAPTVDH